MKAEDGRREKERYFILTGGAIGFDSNSSSGGHAVSLLLRCPSIIGQIFSKIITIIDRETAPAQFNMRSQMYQKISMCLKERSDGLVFE